MFPVDDIMDKDSFILLIVNTVAADDLVMQGTRALAVMVLTMFVFSTLASAL